MSNFPIWRILRSRQALWLWSGSALLVVAGACVLHTSAKRERGPNWPQDANYHWTRELDLTHGIATSENEFTVGGVSYINGKLYASCGYRNTDLNRAALIRGIVDSYGRFWPDIVLEATHDFSSRWKRIGTSPHFRGKSETKELAPGQVIGVNVDLNPYRALIRKYRYARLVTESGVSATFELKNILPPCENWPAGMDCLPTPPEPELLPVSEPETKK